MSLTVAVGVQAIQGSRREYAESYLPDLEARKQRSRDAEAKRQQEDMARIARDVQAGQHGTVTPLFGSNDEGRRDDEGRGDAGPNDEGR